MRKVKLLEFYEMLCNHDWFYFYSDDPNINSKGAREESVVKEMAFSDKLFKEMYDKFYDAKFHGKKIPELKEFV